MAHASESVQSSKSAHAAKDAGAEQHSAVEPESQEARLRRAEKLIRRNVYWALGVGIIPFPIVDLVGLTAVELKMIKELADSYQVKFTENTAKSILASLAVSIGSVGIAEVVTGSLFKLIPAVGQVVGLVSVSIIAAAFTQAVGNVFLMHFESGGTLLNFKPETMREYFRKEFDKAKTTVAHLKKDEAKDGGKPA